MEKLRIIAVVGPTASGKTALGVKLAQYLCGEIVSADSMQIYKDIPIAAAVPTVEERQGIEHHLMEFLEAGSEFSVADYVNLAKTEIAKIAAKNKMPIVVGGTGLYINSLLDGIEFADISPDKELRESLQQMLENMGAEQMLKELAEFDPETAAKLNPGNTRRIIRAFEVYKTTGITFSEQLRLSRRNESIFDPIVIGVTFRDRKKLYDRIEKRVDIMLENGLLEEAKMSLKTSGSGSAQAIGHKEFYAYFNGEQSLETAVNTLKTETRRYAKRQLTWFNKRTDVNWIYADECDTFEAAKEIIGRELNGKI